MGPLLAAAARLAGGGRLASFSSGITTAKLTGGGSDKQPGEPTPAAQEYTDPTAAITLGRLG